MDDMETLVWCGAIGLMFSLAGAAICYVFKHFAEKRLDEVTLDSKLEILGDVETIHRIGCPGVVLKVACKSKRAAKLAKVEFSVSLTKDELAAWESGFQFPFGQSERPEVPAARLRIRLIPLGEPTNDDGFVLERDDVARFLFPIAIPPLRAFLNAPSEEVQVTATFFDGSTQVLQKGLSVQEMLRDVLDAYQSLPMRLKVTLEMSITVSAEQVADIGTHIGALNTREISFGDPHQPIIEAEFTEERMKQCLSICREIWNHWSTNKAPQYVVVPSREIDLDNPHSAIDATFGVGTTSPTHDIGLVDLLVVFSILGQQAAAMNTIERKDAEDFTVEASVTTRYTNAQASAMLKQIAMSPPSDL